ncbi:hypothetical protein J4G48_0015180 [Bradyrhizobium barranii subsp. apii]|uniref:hypothetical protein n=1 Tax=Bradyrhizobium barranii TaxID=2992140 RepID=UPI001AA17404|nr:hypothetical protein [Bradyrhizobium barranii]UPT99307.1 hypothetical protein J4G48_0015180 [Bradyrhizobium barranii subsp. apii]
MALKWRGRIAVLECDTCDVEVESDKGESFDEFTARRKALGWTADKVGKTDWVHGCPLHKA